MEPSDPPPFCHSICSKSLPPSRIVSFVLLSKSAHRFQGENVNTDCTALPPSLGLCVPPNDTSAAACPSSTPSRYPLTLQLFQMTHSAWCWVLSMYVYVHVCVYMCDCVCIPVFVFACVCMHVCGSMFLYVFSLCAGTHACLCVCVLEEGIKDKREQPDKQRHVEDTQASSGG